MRCFYVIFPHNQIIVIRFVPYVTPKIWDIVLFVVRMIFTCLIHHCCSRNQGLGIVDLFINRIMDIVISLIGIVIASPFMLLIVLAIKLYDHGPILYKQERLTKDGKPFMIYKFRSMTVHSDAGARLAAKGMPRRPWEM